MLRIIVFFQKGLSGQICLPDTKIAVPVITPKTSCLSHSFLCWKAKKLNKIISSANWFFLKVYHGHQKCKFDNSAAIFSSMSEFFCSECEIDRKVSVKSPKNVFRPNAPVDTENALLTLLLLSFLLKWKFSSAQGARKIKSLPMSATFSSVQKVYWRRKLQVWQSPPNVFAKLRIFFRSKCKIQRKNYYRFFIKSNSVKIFSRDTHNANLTALPETFAKIKVLFAQFWKKRRKVKNV